MGKLEDSCYMEDLMSMAATSHMWLLSTWNMARVTEKLNFYLTLNSDLKSSPHNYGQLLFNKVVMIIQWGNDVFSTSGAGTTGFLYTKE